MSTIPRPTHGQGSPTCRPRDHFHAAVLQGQFWAIGGRDAAIDAMVTVNEDFDFTTGRYREHYNTGAQTRLVAALRKARPRP